jgi:hypothetical protein
MLALVPLIANWHSASRAGQTFTRDWAVDLLNSVEPYGVLVTGGDNDTFPLWYAQDVEGVRKDVIVAVTSLLGTDWYVRGIIRRPIYPYDAVAGPAVYRDRAWPRPAGPPLHLTFEEADAIPEYIQLKTPQVFHRDSITATIRPGYLTRDQMMVLRFIKDTFPERPIYFSSPVYANALGLGPHLVMQGLVQALVMRAPDGSDANVVRTPYGAIDVARSRALWSGYRAPAALVKQGDWVDAASANMPMQYILSAYALGDAYHVIGDRADSERFLETALTLAHAAHLDAMFRPAAARN